MTLASQPVCSFASATVSNTGRPRWVEPPLPGAVPPTILVPYAIAASEWNVPFLPVKPWQMTLVFLSIRTDMRRACFRLYLLPGRMTAVQSGCSIEGISAEKDFMRLPLIENDCVDRRSALDAIPHSPIGLDLFTRRLRCSEQTFHIRRVQREGRKMRHSASIERR